MSEEAANKFVWTIVWETNPDWYKKLEKNGYTTEELVRAAAENDYGEFTEEEYNESMERMQEAVRKIR
jgi:hypothetical protein